MLLINMFKPVSVEQEKSRTVKRYSVQPSVCVKGGPFSVWSGGVISGRHRR